MSSTRPRGGEGAGRSGKRNPPPALVRLAFRLLLPADEREFFLGDLEEAGDRRSWAREMFGAMKLRWNRPKLPRTPNPSPTPRRGDGTVQELLHDLRFGFRMMVRSPGFTIVALLTMALGIGANTAMFSVVHGILLKPLPYPEADRIVSLRESNISRGWSQFSIAPLNYWDWEERNRSFERLAAYRTTMVTLTGGDRPESLVSYRVTEDFLPILGGEPEVGRGIDSEDLVLGAAPVALLTHDLWQNNYGGDPDVIGRTIVLNGVSHTVIGITPRGWKALARTRSDLILPLQESPFWRQARGAHFLSALGRLGPGVTVDQARADLSSIAAALEEEYPDSNTGWDAVVRPLDDVLLGQSGPQLLILLACVGLVLLIACANVANMTLARATVRARELAIRTAVGAGRGRVVRQLLAESLSLAVIGGALGVVLAYVSLQAFVATWPTMLPRMEEIEISSAVLLFSMAVSLLSGVLFGLVPALQVAGPDLNRTLRQGSRGIAGDRSRRWTRIGLVVAEVSLAVVLLIGSGLLIRSFSALSGEDPGFVADDRLAFSTPLPSANYPEGSDILAYGEAALERFGALPGVEAVALSSMLPISGEDEVWTVHLADRPYEGPEDDIGTLVYRVSPGYFDAMGIPVLAGRDFTSTDRGEGIWPVAVSERFVEQHLSGTDPIGTRVRSGIGEDDPWMEIIAVVGEVQHYRLGESTIPQVYFPFAVRPTGGMEFIVKSGVPPLSLVSSVRDVVKALDPDQPIVRLKAAEDMISESIAMPRFRTLLMTGFGLTALLLAVVGLYGVMAYGVSQRSKEIGVRMALGASRGSVLNLVFREGVPLVGFGLAAGLVVSLALSRILESMLFGVGVRDLGVFLAAPLVLLSVATAAMIIPARRAARMDPVKTLGDD